MPDFIKKVLRKFTDGRRDVRRGFFASFFKTTDEDYTKAAYIEIDIEQTSDTVAPTLRDARTGAVIVKKDDWQEKKYRPPYIAMKEPVDLMGLLERQPGQSDDAERVGTWFGRLVAKIFPSLSNFDKMIGLQVELQAAQVMQSGKITLKDDEGGESYILDYGASPTHFPTVSTSWGEDGADPIGDISALADLVSADGHVDAAYVILGDAAYKNLLKNEEFQKNVSRDGLGLGMLNPGMRRRGGVYHGIADFGDHTLEIWTYGGRYDTLDDKTPRRFLDSNAVIVIAREEDLDFRTVYGGIPTLGMEEPFASVIPSEVTYGNAASGDGYIRVQHRVYKDESGDTYTAEAKCRPLCIPVSIGRFACIKTKIAD